MKRTPVTSAEHQVRAMMNASKPLPEAPAHAPLREQDKAFWPGVIRARARDEWTESDLVVAVQLCRCQADIEREQKALDEVGTVVENHRGTEVMNPRVAVLEQLARREMALMRTLRMGGRVAGPIRDEDERRRAERSAEKALAEVADGEDFLA